MRTNHQQSRNRNQSQVAQIPVRQILILGSLLPLTGALIWLLFG